MAKRKENDELLGKVLGKHEGPLKELNFLNTVFAFLNRRSTYLAQPGQSKKVIQVVHKHIDAAKKREMDIRLEQQKEQEKEQEEDENKQSPDAVTTDAVSAVASESTTANVGTSTSIGVGTDTVSKDTVTSTSTSMAVGTDTPMTDISGANEDEKGNESEDDDKPPLEGNGGTTDKYVWTQTLQSVELQLQVPANLRGRDFNVSITKKRLTVGIKGREPIIKGVLHEEIDNDDSTWTLDKYVKASETKTMNIILTKKKGMTWWNRVIVGDPEIDTARIEPENSKLGDLDSETRQTVEKMMFDQRQKMMGKPTSKELEQQSIVEKFKKQYPNMDFNNVQFGQ